MASLIFVGYELKSNREIALSANLSAAGEVEGTIRGLIAENAGVWRRGCLNEELSDDERVIFNQLVFAVSFKAFARWNSSNTGISNVDPETFPAFVGNSVYAFPGFARVHESLGFSRNWKEAVLAEASRLRKLDPRPSQDASTCGLF